MFNWKKLKNALQEKYIKKKKKRTKNFLRNEIFF